MKNKLYFQFGEDKPSECFILDNTKITFELDCEDGYTYIEFTDKNNGKTFRLMAGKDNEITKNVVRSKRNKKLERLLK